MAKDGAGMIFEESVGSCLTSTTVVSIREGESAGGRSVVRSRQKEADNVPCEPDSSSSVDVGVKWRTDEGLA